VHLGPAHAVTVAFADAIDDPEMIETAVDMLASLPALQRRRMLCTLAASLLPPCRGAGMR
jgi:hypothetical protein